jgi:hypothetical protein
MDPGTKRLLLIALGLGGVLVCFVGAASLVGHRGGAVPVVSADGRPIRVRPDNPGGMQIDGAENDVFSGAVNAGDARLAPAAETPNPNGLRVAPPAKAAPAVAVPVPAKLAVAPLPDPAPAPPAAPGGSASSGLPQNGPAAAAVGQASRAPAAPVSPSAPAPHAASVQLAALTSEQAAHEEWQRLTHRMPSLLGSRKPTFTRTDRDGHVFWRVRTTGFPDLAQAHSFCEQVRAAGGGCTVADF